MNQATQGHFNRTFRFLINRVRYKRDGILKFDPADRVEADLDADVLLDISGSMEERVNEARVTKWEVVRAGLVSAARQNLTARDRVGLWVFSSTCRQVDRPWAIVSSSSSVTVPSTGAGPSWPRRSPRSRPRAARRTSS
jgi:hypothetical protein